MTLALTDVGRLIKLDTALNRYASDASISTDRAVAWHAVLSTGAPGMTFEEAQTCVIEFYADAGESLTPYALIDAWKRSKRLLPQQIATDVRSARARGIIGREWSERDPLPPEAAEKLRNARARDRELNALEHVSNAVTNAITKD